MGKILYDEKTLLSAKNIIDGCNTAIIDAIGKIDDELANMSKTLNTPNSSKAIVTYKGYADKKLEYVKTMKEKYNNTFNVISNEYHNYSSNVQKTVGGTNG